MACLGKACGITISDSNHFFKSGKEDMIIRIKEEI